MAASRFSRILAVVVLAMSWAATLPARAIDAVGRFILELPTGDVMRHIADLFRGPQLVVGGPAGEIDSALYQHNRHEAGLARLGAVRHI